MKPRINLKKPAHRIGLVVAAAALITGGGLVYGKVTAPEPPREVGLNEALTLIREGSVERADLSDLGGNVVLDLKFGRDVKANYPREYSPTIVDELLKANVETDTKLGVPARDWIDTILPVLPAIIIVGFLIYLLRSGGLTGGIGKLGKRGDEAEVPDVTFDDVAGCDEAVAELREMAEFIKDGKRFTEMGITLPRGVLLSGPPGTGKTLLARAVAGDAKVPFFAVAGSDFVEMIAGVGAKRVRELFDRANKAGKAIIFIDEVDAAGGKRGKGLGGPADNERDSTLVALLNEMDGFKSTEVMVIAATNRPDILDDAITRPGRLDRKVQVALPDRRGREDILRVHVRNRPFEDVDLTSIAHQTPGMSGADLAQLVNEASMVAVRRGSKTVTTADVEEAVAVVTMGRARTSALVTPHDRKVTAWHEAGHTVAALLLDELEDPSYVTIIPRGPAGGLTRIDGSDDIFLPRSKALAQLTMTMAGRASEMVLLDGDYTSGASGDLQSATKLATALVTQYGMAEDGSDAWLAAISERTVEMGGEAGEAVRVRVEDLIRTALADARRLLEGGKALQLLELVATHLEAEESLDRARIKELHRQVYTTKAA